MKTLVEWMTDEGKASEVLTGMDWEKLIPSFGSVTQEQFDKFEKPVQDFFNEHTKRELYEGALKRRFMLLPVSSARDILEDEQLKQRGLWAKLEHQEWDSELVYPEYFVKSSLTKCKIRRRAPRIGEHNQEIYGEELGFSNDEIISLKEADII